MTGAAAVVLGALVCGGCATNDKILREIAIRSMHPPADLMCRDGQPVRILTSPRCERGVCGWSCAPARWKEPKS